MPWTPFWLRGEAPTKIDYRQKGILVLTSSLEDLVVLFFDFVHVWAWGLHKNKVCCRSIPRLGKLARPKPGLWNLLPWVSLMSTYLQQVNNLFHGAGVRSRNLLTARLYSFSPLPAFLDRHFLGLVSPHGIRRGFGHEPFGILLKEAISLVVYDVCGDLRVILSPPFGRNGDLSLEIWAPLSTGRIRT